MAPFNEILDFPFVSVIIPTYKDWDRLNQCLVAISKQTYSVENFEVIVVNNNPLDSLPDYIIRQSNFHFIVEKASGSYQARNSGIALSKGSIIALTDSDCIPDPNWITNAVHLFLNNEKISRIGGNIELFNADIEPRNAELYESVYAFKQAENVKDGKSVTANMFARASLFKSIGFFNGELISGGDFEWSSRASSHGSEIMFGKDVTVRHPARKSVTQLKNKAKRTASNYSLREKENSIVSILLFLYDLRPPLREFKKINQYGSALTFNQKAKVFLIRYYLRVIQSYSVLQIKLNAEPFDDRELNSERQV